MEPEISMESLEALLGRGATADPERPRTPYMKGADADESRRLAALRLDEGDQETAERHLRDAVEQSGGQDAGVLGDLAALMSVQDRSPEALRLFSRSLALEKAADPLVGIGELYRRHGRFRDAVESLRRAIEVEPGNAFLHYELAVTLRDMGERRRALDAISRAVILDPDEAGFHLFHGDLLVALGRAEEALPAFRAAIERSPGEDRLYVRAAVAFERAGRREEAVKALRLAADLNVEDEVVPELLAELSPELAPAKRRRLDPYDRDRLAKIRGEMGL